MDQCVCLDVLEQLLVGRGVEQAVDLGGVESFTLTIQPSP